VNEDTRRIEVQPEGIFIVGSKKLTLHALKARKTRLEGEILRLGIEQRELNAEIKSNTHKIKDLEIELATFNSIEVLAWMQQKEKEHALERERIRQERILANQRAKTFLREYIGEEAYAQLREKGSIKFSGKDGRTYEITSKGVLYRGNSRVCVVHPRNLPLPDFVISVLTTVKEGRLRG